MEPATAEGVCVRVRVCVCVCVFVCVHARCHVDARSRGVARRDLHRRSKKTLAELTAIGVRLRERKGLPELLEAVRALWALCCVVEMHTIVTAPGGLIGELLAAGTALLGQDAELSWSICQVLAIIVCRKEGARALDAMGLILHLRDVACTVHPPSDLDVRSAVALVLAGLLRHEFGCGLLQSKALPLLLDVAAAAAASAEAASIAMQTLRAVVADFGAGSSALRRSARSFSLAHIEPGGDDTDELRVTERRLCVASVLCSLALYEDGRALLARPDNADVMLCVTTWAATAAAGEATTHGAGLATAARAQRGRHHCLSASYSAVAFWGFGVQVNTLFGGGEATAAERADRTPAAGVEPPRASSSSRAPPPHGLTALAAFETADGMLRALIPLPDDSIASCLLGTLGHLAVLPGLSDLLCASPFMATLVARISGAAPGHVRKSWASPCCATCSTGPLLTCATRCGAAMLALRYSSQPSARSRRWPGRGRNRARLACPQVRRPSIRSMRTRPAAAAARQLNHRAVMPPAPWRPPQWQENSQSCGTSLARS